MPSEPQQQQRTKSIMQNFLKLVGLVFFKQVFSQSLSWRESTRYIPETHAKKIPETKNKPYQVNRIGKDSDTHKNFENPQ